MKRQLIGAGMFTFLLAIACAMGGCATGTLHKPTTAGNAGAYAVATYSAAGIAAGKYFALPLCAATPVYPCKTQAVNGKLLAADTAAHDAAIAADHAVNDPTKQKAAADALKDLNAENAKPEVKGQIGGAP